MYYQHSGRLSIGGLLIAVVTGVLASLLLAYAYARGIILIGEAHFAAFATIAFGALVGVVAGYGLVWGKVRNRLAGWWLAERPAQSRSTSAGRCGSLLFSII